LAESGRGTAQALPLELDDEGLEALTAVIEQATERLDSIAARARARRSQGAELAITSTVTWALSSG